MLPRMVKVSVNVHLVGKSAGEKMGGLVNQVLKSLHVECLPDRYSAVY